jgi:DNA-directed RNA polymerase specialized sigma24 family protein
MDLHRRFALGEIDAFEALVRQFQGDIYAWVVRIVRDPGIAEDLTVETLWRIYRARHQFRPDANFAAWARRIATNLALDYLRRKRPERICFRPAAPPQPDHLSSGNAEKIARHLPLRPSCRWRRLAVEDSPTKVRMPGTSVSREGACFARFALRKN